MACVVEIRVGKPLSPEDMTAIVDKWPEKTYASAYIKKTVNYVNATLAGLDGNEAGFPSHINDSVNRAALVQHEDVYAQLADIFPAAASSLHRGGFGENFYVSHPYLHPSRVCIGDKYAIGSAHFVVSGPRYPCPKLDAWHGTSGLAAHTLQTGTAGYFLRVVQCGICHVGDEVILLERPNPSFTIVRICAGLWGPEYTREGRDFLEQLVAMEVLIGRHFRDTAATRLERIKAKDDL